MKTCLPKSKVRRGIVATAMNRRSRHSSSQSIPASSRNEQSFRRAKKQHKDKAFDPFAVDDGGSDFFDDARSFNSRLRTLNAKDVAPTADNQFYSQGASPQINNACKRNPKTNESSVCIISEEKKSGDESIPPFPTKQQGSVHQRKAFSNQA